MKTDVCWTGGEAAVCFGGGCGAGEEKSNRSLSPELAVFDSGAGDLPGAESNAPNPLEELKPREGWGGGDVWTGFASKKLPPLRTGGEICVDARWEEILPRPEKADCFG